MSFNTKNKNRRQGYTLVVFVMFMMCLFSLAAVVIDLGFVRLAKRQMQTMTDSAALDVQRNLRLGGEVDVSRLSPMSEAGPTLIFEDDGTAISGNFRAQPKLGSTSGGRWVPSFQAPQQNPTDDILIGNYQQTDDQHSHTESEVAPSLANYYERPDFESAPDGTDVLVRLRRTGENLPNGGSSGPPVPFLFGRGVVIGGSHDLWQRIERGTMVRQTSIACQAPARTAGAHIEFEDSESETVGLVGLLNVQVTLSQWESATATIESTQFTTFDLPEPGIISIGEPAKNDSASTILRMEATELVGDFPSDSGYVTIVDNLESDGGASVVIGFGFVSVDHEQQTLTKITKEDLNWRRGFQNTSAMVRSTLPYTTEQWNELLTKNRNLYSENVGISAPALVRSEE